MAAKCGKNFPLLLFGFICFFLVLFNFLCSCFLLHFAQSYVNQVETMPTGLNFKGSVQADVITASQIFSNNLRVTDLTIQGRESIFLISDLVNSSSHIRLGKETILQTEKFLLRNSGGKTRFALNFNTLQTSASNCKIDGSAKVFKSINAETVQSSSDTGLSLKSPISHVDISGRKGVTLSSTMGGISMQNSLNISIVSRKKLFLKSKHIFLRGFQHLPSISSSPSVAQSICIKPEDGSLFLAPECS